MSRCHPHLRCRAFTLVELLVVIGIIGLLISILLPALGAARRQAQLTQCLSVQRQIAVGANLHAQSHAGYYPVAGHFVDVPAVTVSAVPPKAIGDATKRKYMYLTLGESFFRGTTVAPWHAAVAHYLGKKKATDGTNNVEIIEDEIGSRSYLKYFLCPSHQAMAADVPESMIYVGGNLIWMLQQSFVINEAVFGINDKLGRLRGQASRVRRPASTVLLIDGLQGGPRAFTWSGGKMNWVTLVNKTAVAPVTLADALQGNAKAGDPQNFDRLRHRGKVNVLFFDGHAETRAIAPQALTDIYILAK